MFISLSYCLGLIFFHLSIFFFFFFWITKNWTVYHEHPFRLIQTCLSFNGCMMWFGNTIIYWIIFFLMGIHVISGFCHLGKFSMWKLLLSASQLLCDKNWVLAVFGQSRDIIPVVESVRPWPKSWTYHPPAAWPRTSHLTSPSFNFFIWKMRERMPLSQGLTRGPMEYGIQRAQHRAGVEQVLPTRSYHVASAQQRCPLTTAGMWILWGQSCVILLCLGR